MSAIINGDSPSVTFSDGTTQATSAIVSGKVPYTNLPAGSVLQVVNATFNTQSSVNSTTFTSSFLTASITPKYSTSKIFVVINTVGFTTTSGALFTTIYRNTTNLGSSAGFIFMASNGTDVPVSMSCLDSPATTSSTSYTLYFRNAGSGGITYVGDATGGTYQTSVITLMEIAG